MLLAEPPPRLERKRVRSPDAKTVSNERMPAVFGVIRVHVASGTVGACH